MVKSKLGALSRKIISFLALILSTCTITSSLIHEATTHRKALPVLRAPLIGSNCLLD
jgi:hypothetical protein